MRHKLEDTATLKTDTAHSIYKSGSARMAAVAFSYVCCTGSKSCNSFLAWLRSQTRRGETRPTMGKEKGKRGEACGRRRVTGKARRGGDSG